MKTEKINKILVEFAGTPSSGKDTIIQKISESNNFNTINIIDESVSRCPLSDDDFEMEILWTIYDTYRSSNEDIA